MNLADYQRSMVKLSFAEHAVVPPELASFELYREMIRARLLAMAQVAFRRTWALLGDAACASSFSRYLAQCAPRSPMIRDVVSSFGSFAESDDSLLDGAAPHACDLLRFEAAKWRVGSAPFALESLDSLDLPVTVGKLRAVDFDGVLVVNPTLERLTLSFDVSSGAEPLAHTLLVYRRRGDDDVRWYRVPSLLGSLLSLHVSRSGSLGSLVQALFSERALGASEMESALSELASALAVAVERDVLWGVLDP